MYIHQVKCEGGKGIYLRVKPSRVGRLLAVSYLYLRAAVNLGSGTPPDPSPRIRFFTSTKLSKPRNGTVEAEGSMIT